MAKRARIGILTAGGDCPGLNAVIRGVAKSLINDYGMRPIGIQDGFKGLVENRMRELNYLDVSGILTLGGTILGTTNRENPFKYPVGRGRQVAYEDLSRRALRNAKKRKLAAVVTIGGDGTQKIAHGMAKLGLNVVGIPKTIDNDLHGTDRTFGHDSAVTVATEALDRLHTTAMSHHRAMVVEMMGRNAGWLALRAGIAGGGDIILIPEIPYDIASVCKEIRNRGRKGKRFSIVVVAEGAKPKGGAVSVRRIVADPNMSIRLGGIAARVAEEIEDATGMEARVTVLGHVQRGGTPTAFDRILATQYGVSAASLVAKKRYGRMVALHGSRITDVALTVAARGPRLVPRTSPLIRAARSVGTCFGDE